MILDIIDVQKMISSGSLHPGDWKEALASLHKKVQENRKRQVLIKQSVTSVPFSYGGNNLELVLLKPTLEWGAITARSILSDFKLLYFEYNNYGQNLEDVLGTQMLVALLKEHNVLLSIDQSSAVVYQYYLDAGTVCKQAIYDNGYYPSGWPFCISIKNSNSVKRTS